MMHHRSKTTKISNTFSYHNNGKNNHAEKYYTKRYKKGSKYFKVSSFLFCLMILLAILSIILMMMLLVNYEEEEVVTVKQQQHQFPPTKTLVILIGNIRGGEPTWESLYRNLLEPNQADLALVVGKVPAAEKTSSLYQRAKYLYEFQERGDDWSPALDKLAGGSHWRTAILPYVQSKRNWSGFLGGVAGIGGSGAIHFLARWYAQLMVKQHNLTAHYDRFVISRTDHYYACPTILDSELDNRHVWVPKEEDYSGICDRHVVCNATSVMTVLNVLPTLFDSQQQQAEDWYKISKGKLQDVKPEQFLQMAWKKQGIVPRRMDRTMFTVMEDGVDTTRGRTARSKDRHPDHPSLKLKYPVEYYASECTCRRHRKYFYTGWPIYYGQCVRNTKWNQYLLGVY